MPREFSIDFRRPNVVNLLVPEPELAPGDPPVVEYRFRADANFDGGFTNIQDVPRRGIRSLSVVDNAHNDGRFRGKVRFLFDPDDYSAAGISDGAPFFLQMATREQGGAFGAFGAIHTIIPYDPSSDPPFILNGDAPAAATIAGSAEIHLPRNVDEVTIKNISGVNLHVAFQSGGPEYQIDPAEILTISDTSISLLFVRGEGGAATFNVIAALQNSSMK